MIQLDILNDIVRRYIKQRISTTYVYIYNTNDF